MRDIACRMEQNRGQNNQVFLGYYTYRSARQLVEIDQINLIHPVTMVPDLQPPSVFQGSLILIVSQEKQKQNLPLPGYNLYLSFWYPRVC